MKKRLLFLTLPLYLLTLSGCEKDLSNKRYIVHFDANTDVANNGTTDVSIRHGHRAKKPNLYSIDETKQNYVVFGWYQEKEFKNEWVFKKNIVTSDLTLYAKWGYEYNINYYVGNNLITPAYTEKVRENNCLSEHPEYAVGFDYQGSFYDKEYTVPVDFSKPITADTNIYVRKSMSINISETSESGVLSEYLEPKSSSEGGTSPKEGWVEPISINDKKYTYVNFGYSPVNGDSYVEFATHLDITHSKKINLVFKNLGKAKEIKLYFTSMIDVTNNQYSETGDDYSETLMVSQTLTQQEREMSKTDDTWISKEFDLASVYKNGYSVWGTSPYLGALRIQFSYVGTSKNDYSNEVIFKEITASNYEVSTSDSETVKSLIQAGNDSEIDLSNASASQESVKGFIFPKDRNLISSPVDFSYFNKGKGDHVGLALYTENEVSLREKGYSMSSITFTPNETPLWLLEDYSTFHIKLKNYGYNTTLGIKIYNSTGGLVETSVNISNQSYLEYSDYLVNLSDKSLMTGTLNKLVLTYQSLGIDNLLEIEKIYFTDYKSFDTAGINFNDKHKLDFNESDDVSIEHYRTNIMGSLRFTVNRTGVELTSNKWEDTPFTTDGYENMALRFYKRSETNVSKVKLTYILTDNSTDSYEFDISNSQVGVIAQSVIVDFNKSNRGLVKGIKLQFIGTGLIEISAIEFLTSETHGVNLARDYSGFMYDSWIHKGKYNYDVASSSSLIVPFVNERCTWRIFLGATYKFFGVDHPVENASLDGKSVIKVVYQNRTNEEISLSLNVALSLDKDGTGETKVDPNENLTSATLLKNMQYYEWNIATFDITNIVNKYQSSEYYIARYALSFEGSSLYLRAISIE